MTGIARSLSFRGHQLRFGPSGHHPSPKAVVLPRQFRGLQADDEYRRTDRGLTKIGGPFFGWMIVRAFVSFFKLYASFEEPSRLGGR